MVYLYWDAVDFGISSHTEVKAVYATVEEAISQAVYDYEIGRHPIRVEDDGVVVWTPEV